MSWTILWIGFAIVGAIVLMALAGLAIIGWAYVNSDAYVIDRLERKHGLKDD